MPYREHRFEKREPGRNQWKIQDFDAELASLGLHATDFARVHPGSIEEFEASLPSVQARAILYSYSGFAVLKIYVHTK